jgi:hypothetical protein
MSDDEVIRGGTHPWADVVPEVLNDRDRMIVREARTEIRETPLPESRGPVGCLGAILGAGVLLVWPQLIDVIPGGDFLSPFVMLLGVVLVVGGIVSSFFVGKKTRSAHAAVEAALRQLESEASTAALSSDERETALRAATLLISHAFISDGPSTVEGFDRAEAATRIGPAMGLVLGVQGVLEGELGVWIPFEVAPDDQ